MKSVIYGCKSTSLTTFEQEFFAKEKPFGLILFARNCENPSQLKALIAEFRAIVGRSDAAILIDQEGGRVQRLKPPFCPLYPPAKLFADLYLTDIAAAKRACYLGMRLIGQDLHELGINVNCVPCADLLQPITHDIIGDRSYGTRIAPIIALATEAFEGLKDSGVVGVLKHIPGHGRAKSDSHLELPIVNTSLSELKRTDFQVFKQLSDVRMPFAMTAHVVFSAIDKECATFSIAINHNIIRSYCHFYGFIMSDDLSMKALSGTFAERTKKAYQAGCDIILHCNGDEDEMRDIATQSKSFIKNFFGNPNKVFNAYPHIPFDKPAAIREFESLTGFKLSSCNNQN